MNNKLIEQLIEQKIQEKFQSLLFLNKNQTPYHTHNSVDGTPQIDPVNLLPFTVYSAVPTDAAPNGTFKLVYDGTNYRIYFRVNNLWKYAALT